MHDEHRIHAEGDPLVIVVLQRLLGTDYNWMQRTLLEQVKHHTQLGVHAVVAYAQDDLLVKLLRSSSLRQEIKGRRLFLVRYASAASCHVEACIPPMLPHLCIPPDSSPFAHSADKLLVDGYDEVPFRIFHTALFLVHVPVILTLFFCSLCMSIFPPSPFPLIIVHASQAASHS
jgi:hypothetical protein